MKTNNFAEALLEINKQLVEKQSHLVSGGQVTIEILHNCGDKTIVTVERKRAEVYTPYYARSKM